MATNDEIRDILLDILNDKGTVPSLDINSIKPGVASGNFVPEGIIMVTPIELPDECKEALIAKNKESLWKLSAELCMKGKIGVYMVDSFNVRPETLAKMTPDKLMEHYQGCLKQAFPNANLQLRIAKEFTALASLPQVATTEQISKEIYSGMVKGAKKAILLIPMPTH